MSYFLAQPTFSTLDLKKANYEYFCLEINRYYNSELRPLHYFMPIIKYFGDRTELQFNNCDLVVEQNNHTNKIVNAYIVYELDNGPKNLLNYEKLLVCCH